MRTYIHIQTNPDDDMMEVAKVALDSLAWAFPERLDPLPRIIIERTDEGVIAEVAE